MEYASEHERNFGGGLDEHALEQHEPMAAERRPVGGTGPYVPLQRGTAQAVTRSHPGFETHQFPERVV